MRICEVKTTASSQSEIETRIIRLSQEQGGAWVYSVKPFTNEVTYTRYKMPSDVPDRCYDTADGKIGWNGSLVTFTKAARIREQNRGISSL